MDYRFDMALRRRSLATGVSLLALVSGAELLRADSAPWWNTHWHWRRVVSAPQPRSNRDGGDAAWVEAYLNGAAKPDGTDIRVTTAGGKPVKHFVMQTGPGDLARVCFALSARTQKYHIYYGNAQAEALGDTWRPQRGVLLEGWAYRGGSIGSLTLTQQTFKKAGQPTGRTFVPNVYLGHNPFGPPSHYCHLYTGWLWCVRPGRYAFATTSKDASFLLIDGKTVVQWAGRHPPVSDARHVGHVELARGLHLLTYYHVSAGPNGRAVAAWQPPGTAKPTVIPPGAFMPIARAACGDLERYGSGAQADFDVDGPHETFFKDRYTFRYVFTGKLGGRTDSKTRFTWDFGDGVTAEGAKVEHVFLSAQVRAVTLTASRGGRRSSIRNGISVTRNWNRVTESKIDPLESHAKIVAGYPFGEMSPADLSGAVWLLNRTGRTKQSLAAIEALPKRIDQVRPGTVVRALPELYDLLVTGAGPSEGGVSRSDSASRAARLFEAMEKGADDATVKAAAAALAGRTCLEELGDLRRAEACFKRVVEQYGDRTRDPAVRRARIGLGDVYLRTGRYRLAERALDQAGVVGEAAKRNIRIGNYAHAVDDYIRRKIYATAEERLDRWEWEFPLEKLRGYSTLLRARLYNGQKRYPQIIRLVEAFPLVIVAGDKPDDPIDVIALTIDPAKLPEMYNIDPLTGRIKSASGTAFPPNLYGMDMGLLAADAHVALEQPDKARNVLKVLVRLYPDSPLLGEAKKRLKKLGG